MAFNDKFDVVSNPIVQSLYVEDRINNNILPPGGEYAWITNLDEDVVDDNGVLIVFKIA
jgi:hypothetical protein